MTDVPSPSTPTPQAAPLPAIIPTTIPIGPTTVAGTGISTVAFVLAIIAALSGHSDAQIVEIIVSGGVGLATVVVTLAGRYLQAHAAIKALGAPALRP